MLNDRSNFLARSSPRGLEFSRRFGWLKKALCTLVGLSTGLLSLQVGAQTLPEPDQDCADLENPLFIEAGDTQMRMLGELARKLRDDVEPMTLVYLPRSTCTLAENVFSGNNTIENMRYVPSLAEETEWDGTPRQCNNVDGGFPIDIAIGATFISSCSEDVQNLQPDAMGRFRGPVQAYGFVVPDGVADSVQGITREEAFFVFSGRGEAANAIPWTAPPNPEGGTPTVFIRSATTSTLLTLASNVAPDLLPPSAWIGYRLEGQEDRSSVVIQGVSAARGTPLEEATIGMLGVELYDRERESLDILAYQAAGQTYGYYPDSSPSARDKRNVRDGHYVPWAYTEYVTEVDGSGEPIKPNAARLLSLVTGNSETRLVSAAGVTPAFDVDALAVVAAAGLVPECAMTVEREFDGGDLSLYEAESPCGCFYETVQDPSLLTDPPEAWSDRCVACDPDNDCVDGDCRRGFCEAR
jgi:hypothetical protein